MKGEQSMDKQPSSQQIWRHLLDSGGYSIGQFSISLEDDQVRVFHYGTKKVKYLDRDTSFEDMKKLCKARGYSLSYLLKNYYPKSFRSLTNYRAAHS